MKNKFGQDIRIVNIRDVYNQLVEAKVRHLKNQRDRYRKYITQMPNSNRTVKNNTLMAEQLCLLAKWETANRKGI